MRPINIFGTISLCLLAIFLPPLAFAIRVAVDKEELLLHTGNLLPLCICIGLTLLGWLPGSWDVRTRFFSVFDPTSEKSLLPPLLLFTPLTPFLT
jgi:hypothetical protein